MNNVIVCVHLITCIIRNIYNNIYPFMLCYLYILHVYTCMYQYILGAHGSIVPIRDLVLI